MSAAPENGNTIQHRGGVLSEAEPAPPVIVVYRNAHESLGPLRWAITETKVTGAQLVVVHQSPIAVGVHNGPSALAAHTLGDPTWATMYSVVRGLGAAESAQTVVESAPEHELVERYASEGSRIAVSGKFHARRLGRQLASLPVEIIRIPRRWVTPTNGAGAVGLPEQTTQTHLSDRRVLQPAG